MYDHKTSSRSGRIATSEDASIPFRIDGMSMSCGDAGAPLTVDRLNPHLSDRQACPTRHKAFRVLHHISPPARPAG